MADRLGLEKWDPLAAGHVPVTRAIREYNEEHPQSALAFLSPDEYRQTYSEGQINLNLENKLEGTPKAA